MKNGVACAIVVGLEADVQAIEKAEVLMNKFAVPWGRTGTALPHHHVGLAVVVQDSLAPGTGDHVVQVGVGGETSVGPQHVRHDDRWTDPTPGR